MTLQEAKDELCKEAWKLNEPCDAGLLTQLYHTHHNQGAQHNSDLASDLSNDGIILYIVVIALFYVSVVVVLVLTSLRQKRMRAANYGGEKRSQVVQCTHQGVVSTKVMDPTEEDEDDIAEHV